MEYDPYRSMTELGTGNVLDEGDIRSEIFDSEIFPSDVNIIAVYI